MRHDETQQERNEYRLVMGLFDDKLQNHLPIQPVFCP